MSKYQKYLNRIANDIYHRQPPVERGFKIIIRNNKLMVIPPKSMLRGDILILKLCDLDIQAGLTGGQWLMIQSYIAKIIETEKNNEKLNQNSNSN